MAKPAIADTSSHEVKYPLHSGTHPLDPLTYAELEGVVRIIHESGHFHSDMRFVTITAKEPPRDLVRAYTPGTPYERLADVVISDGRARKTIEATVSLSQRRVFAIGPTRHQGQAPITPDEFVEVEIPRAPTGRRAERQPHRKRNGGDAQSHIEAARSCIGGQCDRGF